MITQQTSRRARVRLLVAVALVVGAGGCAGSSSLVNVWRDPEGGQPVHRVLVVAMRRNPVMRRVWEGGFVSELHNNGVEAAPSYRMFPEAAPDTNQIQDLIASQQADAMISIHALPTETATHYVPGYTTVEPTSRYNPWRGWYQTRYAEVYNPGYVETDRIVRYQVDVSRTGDQGGLIWSGVTETIDPRSSTAVNREVSKLIVPELVHSRILAGRR